MKPEGKKFLLTLLIAFLLLTGVLLAYFRYAKSTGNTCKTTVAVCGKASGTGCL